MRSSVTPRKSRYTISTVMTDLTRPQAEVRASEALAALISEISEIFSAASSEAVQETSAKTVPDAATTLRSVSASRLRKRHSAARNRSNTSVSRAVSSAAEAAQRTQAA